MSELKQEAPTSAVSTPTVNKSPMTTPKKTTPNGVVIPPLSTLNQNTQIEEPILVIEPTVAPVC